MSNYFSDIYIYIFIYVIKIKYTHTFIGYIDRELFVDWFTKICIPHCGTGRPVLLLLDNLDAHMSIEVVDAARANQVGMRTLYKHDVYSFIVPACTMFSIHNY